MPLGYSASLTVARAEQVLSGVRGRGPSTTDIQPAAVQEPGQQRKGMNVMNQIKWMETYHGNGRAFYGGIPDKQRT
jgi:hypothetical protein